MAELYNRLKEYSQNGRYPLHMPGHKRNIDGYNQSDDPLSSVLPLDITEIDGFDNLHDASGVIKEVEDRIAKLYGSSSTHIMVNGSTGGILSAIAAIASRGDTLLMARNCHKSVYHAAFLNKLKCVYLYPEFKEEFDINGPVTVDEVKNQIEAAESEQCKIAAVILTSPTYDGIVSDINNIAKLVHEHDIPLIVDEAHGAHFGFEEHYPESSVSYADIVIHSVHKTLPAPTQTAIIHINSELIDVQEVEKYLAIYQTSSPSYLLMAGVDRAMDILEAEGKERLNRLYLLRCKLDEELKLLTNIKICPDTEPGKLLVSLKGTGMTGLWLSNKLRDEYNIETEMSCATYALGILSMMDTEDGINLIAQALKEIDLSISLNQDEDISKSLKDTGHNIKMPPHLIASKPIYEAWDLSGRWLNVDESVGEVAAEFVNLYPPGIPLAVPGEVISEELVRLLKEYKGEGFNIQGMDNEKIKVL